MSTLSDTSLDTEDAYAEGYDLALDWAKHDATACDFDALIGGEAGRASSIIIDEKSAPTLFALLAPRYAEKCVLDLLMDLASQGIQAAAFDVWAALDDSDGEYSHLLTDGERTAILARLDAV